MKHFVNMEMGVDGHSCYIRWSIMDEHSSVAHDSGFERINDDMYARIQADPMGEHLAAEQCLPECWIAAGRADSSRDGCSMSCEIEPV